MARTTISNLFGSSPVRPLQKHMEAVQHCVSELVPFLEMVLQKNWDSAGPQQKKISQLEQDADSLKRELRLNLPNSLFMPVSRRDILEVLSMQDSIANAAKDVVGLITGRRMEIPPTMGDAFLAFARRCVEASSQAQVAINELDELVETGFRGREVTLVQSMIKTLDDIESDTDCLEIKIRAQLFQLENDLHPVHVMFLYKIIDGIGEVANRAQRVGSRLELMLAR